MAAIVPHRVRLLIDATCFDGYHQGTRTYLLGLYGALVKQTIDIDFYFAACDITTLQQHFGLADHLHYIQLRSRNKGWRLLFEYPQLISRYQIDICHFQYFPPLVKRCQEIVTIHDVLFLDFPHYFSLFYRVLRHLPFAYFSRRADCLLTVSEYSKQAMARHFHLSSVEVIPNGFNDRLLRDQIAPAIGFDRWSKAIVYVSRLEPRKNHIELLRSFVALKLSERGYHLVMIGYHNIPIPELDSYWESLEESQKKSVLWVSSVSDQELGYILSHCALFVYPSLAEGFGIPPLEAYLCGAPTICAQTTAMCDFDFLKNCFFDPHHHGDLQQKMIQLLESEQFISQEDRLRVQRQYQWSTIAGQYLELLHQKFNINSPL